MVRLCTFRNGRITGTRGIVRLARRRQHGPHVRRDAAPPAEVTADPPGPDPPPYGAPCRHCGQNPVSRPRGLCYACFYNPAVRRLYPPTSKFARQGNGTGHGGYRLPPEPTDALPGTPEKVAVLEERARLRQCLWHPEDAKCQRSVDTSPSRAWVAFVPSCNNFGLPALRPPALASLRAPGSVNHWLTHAVPRGGRHPGADVVTYPEDR
jgi:hypothetical protein